MNPIRSYGIQKFSKFTPSEQIKAIDKLIGELELGLSDKGKYEAMVGNILELIPFLKGEMPPKMHEFVRALNPNINAHDLLQPICAYNADCTRKDNQLAIKTGDGQPDDLPEHSARAAGITLVCDNLRSVFNVGSLFRSAECLGIAEVLLCGISPLPSHPNMSKTAMGTESKVKWQHFDNTEDALNYCRSLGHSIYALETVSEAKSVFGAIYMLPMALVVGNESLGISPDVLAKCDYYIKLPMLGWKNSLNVAVATTAALYHIVFGDKHG
jgi:tRNA G18 (ribose-2'-O)-methylase SpoU